MQSQARPVFSVVVPMFDEAEIIGEMHRRLAAAMATLDAPWEVIYVNDGSRDATLRIVETLRLADSHIALVNLSRNFGKEIATTAGLDHARGDAVIVIDADLQDPPEVIPRLVAAWRDGFDMVYAQRRRRDGETWLKKTHGRGILSHHAQARRCAAAAERRRLPADEPPRGRCRAAVARAPSLHEGSVRLGGLSQHRR